MQTFFCCLVKGILSEKTFLRLRYNRTSSSPHQVFYCLVEAKRLRQSSFQRLQLAREFLLAHSRAEGRIPLLLLILNKPPPVLIQGQGRQSLTDAIIAGLPEVISRPEAAPTWHSKIDQTVSWVTWHEITEVVRRQLESIDVADSSLAASIRRLVESIVNSIEWHDKVRLRAPSQ